MSDRYDDVRAYDPTWDEWTAGLSDTEKASAATMLRDSFGYRCWRIGVKAESFLGPKRDAILRKLGVIPEGA